MAFVIRRRAIVAAAVSVTALSGAGMRAAQAQAKTGLAVYPVAVPTYQVQFVAQEKGFFRDEGYEFKLVQGGSGVKTREILASRQANLLEIGELKDVAGWNGLIGADAYARGRKGGYVE